MEKKSNNRKYLYHYTDVDSLALIMKNKTIRLNPLDKMDDLQEQMSEDKQNYGKFVFVSSWTADATESIPMWRMYTSKQRGVRIKLPINPFVEYITPWEEISKHTHSDVIIGNVEAQIDLKTIIPISEVFDQDYFLINYLTDSQHQLFEVEYTDDDSLLKPNISKNNNDGYSINLNNVGIYKNKYWEFQKEWRYRLMFLPISMEKLVKEQLHGKNTEIQKLQLRTMTGRAYLPINYYDLTIKDEDYADMGIMLSPDISESSKIFVEFLVKEYCPSCTINESVLSNLIK